LTASTVNGSGNGARSGAQTLSLLADPLEVAVLRSLSAGPKRQVELRREAGSPAQSTLRAHLKGLEAIGAIARRRRNAFPGTVEYELEKPGEELLSVAVILERWLEAAPGGPLALGEDAAKAAIRALAEGWSSTMLRALAAGPLSLTELDRLIGALNYPSLERRLAAMRLAGLVEPAPSNAKGTPYAVTGWLRRGVGPLVAAIRWERRNAPARTAPPGRIDVEAVFLLAVPLLRLPEELSGVCRLALEIPSGGERRLAGVLVEVEGGRVASCAARPGGDPDAWASGSLSAWLAALTEADPDGLELGGDCRFARALLEALVEALLGAAPARGPAQTPAARPNWYWVSVN
jgi:DNA-binding HxlR family transcriptional regulator